MKFAKQLLSCILASAMIFAAVPFAANAYGADNKQLCITHINTANSFEGAAVIMSGTAGSSVGAFGGYDWWKVIVFDWDAEESVYKVASLHLNTGSGASKASVKIPEKGFAYGVCVGNDYSATGGVNYINSRTKDSYNFITTLNPDLSN